MSANYRRVGWLVGLIVLFLSAGAALYLWWPAQRAQPLAADWRATVSVIGDDSTFVEPFGVAAGADGVLYVSDGLADRVYAITRDGSITPVADGFRTPSGVAAGPAGTLYIADTGNNAVHRLDPGGQRTTIARNLNGPVGIAVDPSGRVIVADTYSDRLCSVEPDGTCRVLAIDVPLDTPTGLAVDSRDGTIYVADTGHDVVHAIPAPGGVRTLDAADIGGFRRPTGVAVDDRGVIFVVDESARVIEISTAGAARIVAGSSPGFENGIGEDAQFRRPSSVAVVSTGRLVVADAGNGLVRDVVATTLAEFKPPPSPWIAPEFDVEAFSAQPLLWPLEPLYGPFEVAGTLGEARGGEGGRFHAGIDVRAEQGEHVLAVRAGVVTSPVATGDVGTLNEWLRIGPLTYVHLRVGRTMQGDVLDTSRFVPTYDERGRVARMRVKRGATFGVGDVVGTVNAFNHVHLNVGFGGEEYNPLLFRLVQFEDTIAPTIARGGVALFDPQWAPLAKRERGRVLVSGPVQIVVDAWDQADGNRPNRRLGVYALGYQVLHDDGTPAPGFEHPLETIRFDQLQDPTAARLVYAPGSGIPFYGQRRTRFLYVVTNSFRHGVATPGLWDTASLPPGNYTVRVIARDLSGNEAMVNRDLKVTITGREPIPGA